MSKTVISTTNAPAAIGPYSQAIATDGCIFISGQICADKDGNMATEIKQATKLCLNNLQAIAEQAGCTLANVVKTTVFLTDLANFAAMNEVYATYFTDAPPARSTVQVAALPKGAIVEIEAILSK